MTASTESTDSLFKDIYPRPGERIKQWVVDVRREDAWARETCPRFTMDPHNDGHRRSVPVGVAPDPEAAAAWVAKMIRAWSMDAAAVHEECPAFYFVPVPKEAP